MSKLLKKPTSYSQQIQLLRQRSILISDPAECELFLSRVNYYLLSGYILPFIDTAHDRCRVPVPFETIQGIYNFDMELRNLLALNIERIEIYIRTQILHFHSHAYGAMGYMDPLNYNLKHNHAAFVNHIQSCINENSKSPAIKHHIQNYGGNFPLWVIMNYFSLGMLSHFYTDLKNPDKAFLAKSMYDANYQMLSSWLHCLTDLRNRCAHYSRLYYWKFPALPVMKDLPIIPDRTLFTQIYILKTMHPDADEYHNRLFIPLEALINKYCSYINLNHIGFADNWKPLLV